MQTLVIFEFPYSGPWGQEMAAALQELAHDIARESGLLWKLWTENRAEGTAGGVYLFASREAAERYAEKHCARLAGLGIRGVQARVFDAQHQLSAITHAGALLSGNRPQFFLTPGYGQRQLDNFHYSQAVRMGNRVELAGQGGWSDEWQFPEALEDEIAQAFDNVTRTLAAAGAGWEHVVHINSYHVGFEPSVNDIMSAHFRRYMPNHAPVWTVLGVEKLGDPKMRVEIRVTAILPG